MTLAEEAISLVDGMMVMKHWFQVKNFNKSLQMESNLILYTSNNGDVSIQVRYEDGEHFGLVKKNGRIVWSECTYNKRAS